MNYPLPQGHETALWEDRYQQTVAQALKQATDGPVLLKPRERIRGWSWKAYTKTNG